MVPAVLLPRQRRIWQGAAKTKEHAMSQNFNSAVAVIGIDIGKNSFHVVGLADRGAIVASEVVAWADRSTASQFAAVPNRHGSLRWCASSQSEAEGIGSRRSADASEVCTAVLKGQKNDFRDAEAIADAVQRPTMKFVATKTVEQLDLQALHRVRERLVSQRTGIINQIRAFLLERGVAIRQGLRFLRAELPRILATSPDVLSARMVRVIRDLAEDWRRLDERIDQLSSEIAVLARQDA